MRATPARCGVLSHLEAVPCTTPPLPLGRAGLSVVSCCGSSLDAFGRERYWRAVIGDTVQPVAAMYTHWREDGPPVAGLLPVAPCRLCLGAAPLRVPGQSSAPPRLMSRRPQNAEVR
ncbi:hypothetical protein MRX96_032238 [Rhipicephalus microplus]